MTVLRQAREYVMDDKLHEWAGRWCSSRTTPI